MSNLIDLEKYLSKRKKPNKIKPFALVVLILMTLSIVLSVLGVLLRHLP